MKLYTWVFDFIRTTLPKGQVIIAIWSDDKNQYTIKLTEAMAPFIFALTSLFFAVALFIIRRRYFHPLSKFPGPFLASVTSLYQTYWHVHADKPSHDAELHRIYGTVN